MRIGIVGAGGVGGLLAGLLARGGHDVALVTRGAARDAIRQHGLRVDSPLGVFAVPVQAGAVDELAPVDVVLVAVKTWQVPEVARSLGPILRRDTIVVPLQNGVDAPDQCADAVGDDRAFGGICHVLSWIAEPGAIKHVAAPPRVTLGAWRVPVDARVRALKDALEGSGIAARLPDDFAAALWDKFLFIASFGGVGAISRAGAGPMRTIPATRRLLTDAFQEVFDVARAKGVALPSDTVDKALALTDSVPADAIASLQRDVVAGRPSEIDSLSGAVVRNGAAVHVKVPVHATIHAALQPLEAIARAPRGDRKDA